MVAIYSPNFAAGLILQDGIVKTAAPVIKYMVGWSVDKVISHCAAKRWQWEDHSHLEVEHGVRQPVR